ncbi:hypothetical protein BH09VER1_BH09VER1_39900 [soil metagenome]
MGPNYSKSARAGKKDTVQLERPMRSATLLTLVFLLSIPGGSFGLPPTKTDAYLDTDNIRMIALLRGMTDARIGEKIPGLTLQDGTLTLKDSIFLGSLIIPWRKQHIYTFRTGGRENSYVWIEPKGVPLKVPPSPRNNFQEFAYKLSGDAYKFTEVHPGAGVIVLPGGSKKWLKQLRAESKKWP